MQMKTNEHAVSSLVGVAVLVGITSLLGGAVFAVGSSIASEPVEDPQLSAVQSRNHGSAAELTLSHVAGHEIPTQFSTLRVTSDGSTTTHALTDISALDGHSSWTAGLDVCVVGTGDGCLLDEADTVHVQIIVGQTLIHDTTYKLPSQDAEEGGHNHVHDHEDVPEEEDNNAKVDICHKANNKNVEISVSANSLDAHLAHGDTLGACEVLIV